MNLYASTADVIKYRGPQEAETLEKIRNVLPACTAALRQYAMQAGVNLDAAVSDSEDLLILAQKAVVDASFNYINSVKDNDPLMTQFSQAAGGYSISGTFASVGGGFYFPKSVLRTLGISRQRLRTVEVWDVKHD